MSIIPSSHVTHNTYIKIFTLGITYNKTCASGYVHQNISRHVYINSGHVYQDLYIRHVHQVLCIRTSGRRLPWCLGLSLFRDYHWSMVDLCTVLIDNIIKPLALFSPPFQQYLNTQIMTGGLNQLFIEVISSITYYLNLI